MEGHAIDIILLIPSYDGLRPFLEVVFVMIIRKYEYFWVVEIKSRSEIIVDEVPLARRVVSTSFPRSGKLRLVLRGDCPNGYPFRLVGRDEFGDVEGPG